MVTNFNELTQEEVMSNPSLQKLVYEEIGRTSQYKYHLGNLVGFQNIEEKGKWKEAMMGTVLDQRVFTGSTGEDKGADAVDMPGTTKSAGPEGHDNPRAPNTAINRFAANTGRFNVKTTSNVPATS